MALPTLSTRVPSRFRYPGAYMDWHREREVEKQNQLETHARYLERQSVCTDRHDVWTSSQYLDKSMSEYNKQCRKEHHRASLELRRNRLRTLFQEEMNQLQAEQRDLIQDRKARRGRQQQKGERHSTARQDMREKLEADLLKDFVVTQWKKMQLSEDTQTERADPRAGGRGISGARSKKDVTQNN
ncbi:unnamed protein product [Tetraodon nigroviridis]|uniref:(spotted green pufferfish) hypothetical protein n=1 Tax=Tetraodon nigroviridis TaxID=99883 RepID=Q4S6Q7_TETNG|nr:unnamed protein product [Tetraodon nigroviridis]